MAHLSAFLVFDQAKRKVTGSGSEGNYSAPRAMVAIKLLNANCCKRMGYKHTRLRLIGKLKSEPDTIVLAI
jgi:hypothetical protein